MDAETASHYAALWVQNWNNHDLDAIMAHMHPDITFTSPKAATLAGSATLTGKDALRAYWSAAIDRTITRRFTLDRALWCADQHELIIIYWSDVDGRRVRACELARFDDGGLVIAGEALYGAEG